MLIYLIIGDNGESYSDHEDWDVCAYFDKEAAEQHLKLLEEAVKKLPKDIRWYDIKETRLPNFEHLDKNIRPYRHIKYYIEEIDLYEHVDQMIGSYA